MLTLERRCDERRAVQAMEHSLRSIDPMTLAITTPPWIERGQETLSMVADYDLAFQRLPALFLPFGLVAHEGQVKYLQGPLDRRILSSA